MDDNTAVVLTLQLVALFSIAGALLLYLLFKIRTGVGSDLLDGACPGACKPVLVTSADNAIGLQVCIQIFTSNKFIAVDKITANLLHSFEMNNLIKKISSNVTQTK